MISAPPRPVASEPGVRAVVEGYLQALKLRDVEMVCSFFADSARLETPVGQWQGKQAIREFYTSLFNTFPRYEIQPRAIFVSRDEVSVLWTAQGTLASPPRGVSFPGSSYFALTGMQFRQVRVYYDVGDLSRKMIS